MYVHARRLFVLIGLSLTATVSLHASIVQYASRASWNAAHPGSTLQDFSSISTAPSGYVQYSPNYSTAADGTIEADQTYSNYNYDNYTSSSGSHANNSTSSGGPTPTSEFVFDPATNGFTNFGTGKYLYAGSAQTGSTLGYSNYYSNQTNCGWGCDDSFQNYNYNNGYSSSVPIVITAPTGKTAVAFDLGQFDSYNNASRNVAVTVRTASGAVLNTNVLTPVGSLAFFGFDSNDPSDAITTISLTPVLTPTTTHYVHDTGVYSSTSGSAQYTNRSWYDYTQTQDYSDLALDNLAYAAPSAVPEPGSVISLATVLIAIVAGLSRRSRRLQIG